MNRRNYAQWLLNWFAFPVAWCIFLPAWATPPSHSLPIQQIQAPFVELASKQIPIPDRIWVIASSRRDTQELPNGPALIEHQVLFRVENGAVKAFVLMHANATPAQDGWGISQDCQNHEHPFTAIFERKNHHYKCAFVRNLQTEPEDSAWSAAVAFAARNNWHLPKHWLVTGIRLADRLDVVDVRYGFDPQAFVGAMRTLNLSPHVNEALQQAATQTLIKWHETALYLVGRGFRRQLDGELSLPMPAFGSATPSTIIAGRIKRLTALRTAGWLSPTEFAIQRTLVLESFIPQADVTVDVWSLGAIKTAGHTVQSGFWMWGVNYLFLGNVHLAGSLALAKSFISPVRYYLEELAWNTWGPRRNPTLPVIDFPPEETTIK